MTERKRPDPPPAAPLTAEVVAEPCSRCEGSGHEGRMGMTKCMRCGGTKTEPPLIERLTRENAALRDRLARAERALHLQALVDDHVEGCVECLDEGGCEEGFRLTGDAIDARRALLATPTDGAARAGER